MTHAPNHILITGGAGFIGSHLADAYLQRGWRVSIVDDFSTGDRRNVNPKAALYEMDVARAGPLVRELMPDAISHHAAQMSVIRSIAEPAVDAEVNIVATLRLLEAAAEAKVKRFVFASTGGVIYGEPDYVPADEDHPTRPVSPYGVAKRAVELYLHCFHFVHGLPWVALRYGNVYGPRQSPHGEAGVVAIFAERLLRGESALIHGSGEQTRDYIYIDDIVAANLAATGGDFTGAYNVGTGVETSVNAIYAAVSEALSIERAPTHGPAKREQMRSVIDSRRFRALTGLPEPLPLREGMRRTMDWFRARSAV
jgi:UDP-glucose 4-epimerase